MESLSLVREADVSSDAASTPSADWPGGALVDTLAPSAAARGVQLAYRAQDDCLDIIKGRERIRIAGRNYFYAADMVNAFEYFFGTVEPIQLSSYALADYSKPAWHKLAGSDRRLFFTSLPEGWAEARVYADYLKPKAGEIVLDLGAYCGLSAIMFSEAVGPTGRVVSVEPDPENFAAYKVNLPAVRFPNVDVIPAAVCGTPRSLWFSCEGNMGSRVVSDPSLNRDKLVEVKGITLADLVRRFDLPKVDIIKMDIEGGEYEALEQGVEFLRAVRARWFLEVHDDPDFGGGPNIARIRRLLEASGYLVHQLSKQPLEEYMYPLIYAVPIEGWPFEVVISMSGSIEPTPDTAATPLQSIPCPCCGEPCTRRTRGWLAPFIAERVGSTETEATAHLCDVCDHVFLTPFLTGEQLTRLYTGYRGDGYNAMRVKHEPSYAPLIPLLDDRDSHHFAFRRQYYDLFLGAFRGWSGVVVDYGGGDGYFTDHAFPNCERIVVEEDFERKGGDLVALLRRADFLFCAHVFEHLPQPYPVLERLTSLLRHGAKVYIELPMDYPGDIRTGFSEIEQIIETESYVPWHALNTLHEHVARFSKASMTALALRCGLRPLEYYHSTAGMFGMLAEKPHPRGW